jgi:hypothetical protein
VDKENLIRPENSSAGSFEELAASQGVHPVTEFDALLGHPSDQDESVEDFALMLHEWRNEASSIERRG